MLKRVCLVKLCACGFVIPVLPSIMTGCARTTASEQAQHSSGETPRQEPALTHQEAAEVLKTSSALQGEAYLDINEKVNESCYDLERQAAVEPRMAAWPFLVESGYAKVETRQENYGNGTFTPNVCLVQLTDEGQRQLNRSAVSGGWHVTVATKGFVGISGISVNGNTARVEYVWQWTMSPFGAKLTSSRFASFPSFHNSVQSLPPIGTTGGTAVLRRYDTGWRVEQAW